MKASSYAYVSARLCALNIDSAAACRIPTAADIKIDTNWAEGFTVNQMDTFNKDDSHVYARAAFAAFMSNIGATSEKVCKTLVKILDLEASLQESMQRFEVKEPWQALYKLRKEVYYKEFATVEAIVSQRYAHNVGNLIRTAESGIPIGVATSSKTDDAERVLDALGIRKFIKVVNGADKVQFPKPKPEIYLKTAKALNANPENTMVFEDSKNGLTAAVAAGMKVIAVANPFTQGQLRAQDVLQQDQIVYDIGELPAMIVKMAKAEF